MSKFLDTIKERAKTDKKTIVLPESMDARIYEAAEKNNHPLLKRNDKIFRLVVQKTDPELEEMALGIHVEELAEKSFVSVSKEDNEKIVREFLD